MIYYLTDNHYNCFAGKNIFNALNDELKAKMTFFEDDFKMFEEEEWVNDCELLILNIIGDTCNIPHANEVAEKNIKRYVEKGGKFLLLHGSSAAFWKFDWWREIVGLRWVRPNDPDNVVASTHPKKPFKISKVKSRHPLVAKLKEIDMPTDEIYINLEQTAPIDAFLETKIEEGTFVQSYETINKFGGKMVAFIPGHEPEGIKSENFMYNIEVLINYLLEDKK